MALLTSLIFWVVPERRYLYHIAMLFITLEFLCIMFAGSFLSGLAFVGLFPILIIALINQVIYRNTEPEEEDEEDE